MMDKINWKLRLQNKVTLLALLAAVVGILYTALEMCGAAPQVEQSRVLELARMAVEALVLLGVVADPTTPGMADSTRARGYLRPGG